MSNCFFADVSVHASNGVELDVSEGDVFDFACYKNVNFICGTNSFQSDGAHTQNIPVNYVTYNIRRIKIRGEIRTDEIDDETGGCFYVIFYKTTVSGDGVIPRAINLKQLLHGSKKTDFFLYKQPECVLCYRVFRFNELTGEFKKQSTHFNFYCDKSFSVRPDEVVGVYYMFLGYVINYGFNYDVDASVSVYFDVV